MAMSHPVPLSSVDTCSSLHTIDVTGRRMLLNLLKMSVYVAEQVAALVVVGSSKTATQTSHQALHTGLSLDMVFVERQRVVDVFMHRGA